jgi:hypothetical protein
MSTQEIIESGLIEAYALNLADEVETQWVLKALDESEAARNYLLDFELSLEKTYQSKEATTIPNNETTGKVVRITPWYKYAMAASVLFLLSSLAVNVFLFNKNKQATNELVLVKNTLKTTPQPVPINNNTSTQTTQTAVMEALGTVTDGNYVKQVALKGQNTHAICKCTMFWNKEKGEVVICVHHLVNPGSTKQYQLWGYINGKPTNLGVFDLNEQKLIHHKLKQNYKEIQGFAVTLEDKGGVTEPTMEQLYLKGDI